MAPKIDNAIDNFNDKLTEQFRKNKQLNNQWESIHKDSYESQSILLISKYLSTMASLDTPGLRSNIKSIHSVMTRIPEVDQNAFILKIGFVRNALSLLSAAKNIPPSLLYPLCVHLDQLTRSISLVVNQFGLKPSMQVDETRTLLSFINKSLDTLMYDIDIVFKWDIANTKPGDKIGVVYAMLSKKIDPISTNLQDEYYSLLDNDSNWPDTNMCSIDKLTPPNELTIKNYARFQRNNNQVITKQESITETENRIRNELDVSQSVIARALKVMCITKAYIVSLLVWCVQTTYLAIKSINLSDISLGISNPFALISKKVLGLLGKKTIAFLRVKLSMHIFMPVITKVNAQLVGTWGLKLFQGLVNFSGFALTAVVMYSVWGVSGYFTHALDAPLRLEKTAIAAEVVTEEFVGGTVFDTIAQWTYIPFLNTISNVLQPINSLATDAGHKVALWNYWAALKSGSKITKITYNLNTSSTQPDITEKLELAESVGLSNWLSSFNVSSWVFDFAKFVYDQITGLFAQNWFSIGTAFGAFVFLSGMFLNRDVNTINNIMKPFSKDDLTKLSKDEALRKMRILILQGYKLYKTKVEKLRQRIKPFCDRTLTKEQRELCNKINNL